MNLLVPGDIVRDHECRGPILVCLVEVVELDRRMRLGRLPLSQAEWEALQFVAALYSAHPARTLPVSRV